MGVADKYMAPHDLLGGRLEEELDLPPPRARGNNGLLSQVRQRLDICHLQDRRWYLRPWSQSGVRVTVCSRATASDVRAWTGRRRDERHCHHTHRHLSSPISIATLSIAGSSLLVVMATRGVAIPGKSCQRCCFYSYGPFHRLGSSWATGTVQALQFDVPWP